MRAYARQLRKMVVFAASRPTRRSSTAIIRNSTIPGLWTALLNKPMLRKLTIILAAASALLAQTPKKADTPDAAKPTIDKPKLEAYLRHLFVWPPPIELSIADPQPGPMAAFYEVRIRGSQGNASQEETFYVSKDGQKIIRGNVFDLRSEEH